MKDIFLLFFVGEIKNAFGEIEEKDRKREKFIFFCIGRFSSLRSIVGTTTNMITLVSFLVFALGSFAQARDGRLCISLIHHHVFCANLYVFSAHFRHRAV